MNDHQPFLLSDHSLVIQALRHANLPQLELIGQRHPLLTSSVISQVIALFREEPSISANLALLLLNDPSLRPSLQSRLARTLAVLLLGCACQPSIKTEIEVGQEGSEFGDWLPDIDYSRHTASTMDDQKEDTLYSPQKKQEFQLLLTMSKPEDVKALLDWVPRDSEPSLHLLFLQVSKLLNPSTSNVKALIEGYLSLRQLSKAILQCDLLVRGSFQEDYETLVLISKCYQAGNFLELAVKYRDRAVLLAVKANNMALAYDCYLQLGFLSFTLFRVFEAVYYFRECRRIQPLALEASYFLAEALQAGREPSQAYAVLHSFDLKLYEQQSPDFRKAEKLAFFYLLKATISAEISTFSLQYVQDLFEVARKCFEQFHQSWDQMTDALQDSFSLFALEELPAKDKQLVHLEVERAKANFKRGNRQAAIRIFEDVLQDFQQWDTLGSAAWRVKVYDPKNHKQKFYANYQQLRKCFGNLLKSRLQRRPKITVPHCIQLSELFESIQASGVFDQLEKSIKTHMAAALPYRLGQTDYYNKYEELWSCPQKQELQEMKQKLAPILLKIYKTLLQSAKMLKLWHESQLEQKTLQLAEHIRNKRQLASRATASSSFNLHRMKKIYTRLRRMDLPPFAEMEQVCAKILQLEPQESSFHLKMISLLIRQGKFKEACQHLISSVEYLILSERLEQKAATIAANLKDQTDAQIDYMVSKGTIDQFKALSLHFLLKNDSSFEKMLAQTTENLAQHSKFSWLLFRHMRRQQTSGPPFRQKFARAIANFKVSDCETPLLEDFAQLFEEKGLFPEALRCYQQLYHASNRTELCAKLDYCFKKAGENEKRIEFLTEELALLKTGLQLSPYILQASPRTPPDKSENEKMVHLHEILQQLGSDKVRPSEYYTLLNRLVEAKPLKIDYARQFIQLNLSHGDRTVAVQTLKRSINKDPLNPLLLQDLKDLFQKGVLYPKKSRSSSQMADSVQTLFDDYLKEPLKESLLGRTVFLAFFDELERMERQFQQAMVGLRAIKRNQSMSQQKKSKEFIVAMSSLKKICQKVLKKGVWFLLQAIVFCIDEKLKQANQAFQNFCKTSSLTTSSLKAQQLETHNRLILIFSRLNQMNDPVILASAQRVLSTQDWDRLQQFLTQFQADNGR